MTGLNHKEIQPTLELLKAINQMGITLVVVEHIIKAAIDLCSQIVILHVGAKIGDGTPQEIVNHPEVIDAQLGQDYA